MSFLQQGTDMSSNISYTVKEVPTLHNGQVGIVEATITDARGTRIDFGTADAKSSGSASPEIILDKARNIATNRILQGEHSAYSAPAQRQDFPQTVKQDKTLTNGGGTKPASPKQRELIVSKCKKLKRNPDDVCHTVCGRAFTELQGQDAHAVIQLLIKDSDTTRLS